MRIVYFYDIDSAMDFVNRLISNAYDGLDVTDHIVDVHGWMDRNFEKVFRDAVMARKDVSNPMTIIEVGSWKGLSTSTMARVCKEMGVDAKIVAIDTWLGAPEFWTWGLDDATRGGALSLKGGYPTVFYTFTKNMKKMGYEGVVAPLPLASLCGYDVLEHYKIGADIIYVDAAHEYESVKQDVELYWKLLKEGGTMIGDDYTDYWHGVKRAVDEIFGDRKRIEGVVWSVRK